MSIMTALFMFARNELMETSRSTFSSRYRLCDMSRARVPVPKGKLRIIYIYQLRGCKPPATASFVHVLIAVSGTSIFAS